MKRRSAKTVGSHSKFLSSLGESLLKAPQTRRVRKGQSSALDYESLEPRQVLNAVPVANPDPQFVTAKNTQLTVPFSSRVLANDFDAEGASLTAALVTGTTSGQLSFSSNGTFVYTPNNGFVGRDSFTYKVNDGTVDGGVATVDISVGQTFSAKLNGNERGTNSLLHSGGMVRGTGLVGDHSLNHRADLILPYTFVPVETIFNGAPAGSSLVNLTATLTFNGTSSTVGYSSNLNTLSAGDVLRFSLAADTSSLATGFYNWSVNLTANFSNSTSSQTVFAGSRAVVNWSNSDFGTGFWLNGLDRLYPSTDGALVVDSQGDSRWFLSKPNNTYGAAEGDPTFSTLTKNAQNEFVLTDKWGNKRTYDSTGLLKQVQQVNHVNPMYTYGYTAGKLTSITDEFGDVATLTYGSSNGKLVTFADAQGRTANLGYGGSSGGSPTGFDRNDPNVPLLPLMEQSDSTSSSASYDAAGRLTSMQDAMGNTESFTYDAYGRLSQITHADSTTWQLFPTAKEGLPAFTSGNVPFKKTSMQARFIDERGKTFYFQTDRFGNVVEFKDAIGAVTNWEYSPANILYRSIDADPDAAGPLGRPETRFGHNYVGSTVVVVNPDFSSQKFTVNSLQRVLTAANELNQTSTFTYDAVGNQLTSTDASGNTWSFTYDSHGQVLTEVSPDPDGAGPLTPITTTYQYDASYYRNLTKIINADASTQQFTYDNFDNLLTSTDELGRVTTYNYDSLSRLIEVTLPAVGGVAATYAYVYNGNGQIKREIDALGNFTEYAYNNRTWLSLVREMDPDGSGALQSPETKYEYLPTGQLSKLTMPTYAGTGTFQSFVYDDNGRQIQVNGPTTGEFSTTTYDRMGRVTATGDSSGRVMNYEYDIRSRLVKTLDQDPDGTGPQTRPVVQYSYDLASRVTNVTDPLGRLTTYFYAANGWLNHTHLPDPDLNGPATRPVYSNYYDAVGRVTRTVDALGRQTQNEFNNRHWITQSTSPNTNIFSSYSYDLAGRVTSIAEPMGRTSSYQYDARDQLISVTLPDPDSTGPLTSPVYAYEYDLVGNVTKSTDALGRDTVTQYDSLYRPLSVTQPNPGSGSPVWNYAYGANTLLGAVTDPLGHQTVYSYDNAGRTTQVALPDPDGAGTAFTNSIYSYQYDTLNRIIKVTEPDPDGTAGSQTSSETTYQYDLLSRLSQVTDARNGTTQYSFNSANELTALTDPTGNSTLWSYDGLGRVVQESNALGLTSAMAYDAVGNLVQTIDRNGKIVKFTHDVLDRLLTEKAYTVTGSAPKVVATTATQGSSNTNEIQTIRFSQLSASTPGTFQLSFNGQTTKPIAWNANALAVKQALAELNGVELTDLDVSGPTFSGSERIYSITFIGALANSNQPQIFGTGQFDADPTTLNWTTSWFYDNASRLISTSGYSGINQFSYDQLDRVTQETQNLNAQGLAPQVRLNREYDAVGNRRKLAAEFITGATTVKDFSNDYLFDALDRNYSITQSAQGTGASFNAVTDKTVTMARNQLGQFTFISRYESATASGTNLRSVYSYDQANRLTNLDHRNIGNLVNLSNYTFSYDAMNRIKSIQHTGSVVSDGLSNFTYDATSQLTGADHIPARPDEAYQFDLNGNRTGGGNQVGTNNQTTNDGTYSYLYDGEGNRIRRTKLSDNTYEVSTFDHRNRLTRVSFRSAAGAETKSVSYVYDAMNRMIKRSVDANGPATGGVVDTFFAGYDGINPTVEFSKADPGAGGVAATDLKHRYLWGPVVDQLFADEQITNPSTAGNTLWPLTDQLGTIKDIADFTPGGSFTITNHRTFDSFGKITAESNAAVDMAFAYTGKYFDEVTQLSNHWNRWYDPNLGKWVSEDPLGFVAADSNLSRYVGNGVVDSFDPNGLETVPGIGWQWGGRIYGPEIWLYFGESSVTVEHYERTWAFAHGEVVESYNNNAGRQVLMAAGDLGIPVAEQTAVVLRGLENGSSVIAVGGELAVGLAPGPPVNRLGQGVAAAGGAVAGGVVVGAVVKHADEVAAAAAKKADEVAEAAARNAPVKEADEVLSRLGTSRESASRLGRKAEEAEKIIGIHGVSVSGATPTSPASQAARKKIEEQFRVHDTPTRNDPLHKTVELPKPVTQAVADLFNSIFGR